MSQRPKPSPTANIRHYCRVCDFVIEPVEQESQRDSAHLRALSHRIREHRTDERFVRCSRYCDQREQAEETEAGRQLYGQVIPKPERPAATNTKSYRDLFPDDD
jgi:hypothetical protein